MPNKPTIAFAHGIWADGSCFNKVMAPLAAEGYNVISLAAQPRHSARRHRYVHRHVQSSRWSHRPGRSLVRGHRHHRRRGRRARCCLGLYLRPRM